MENFFVVDPPARVSNRRITGKSVTPTRRVRTPNLVVDPTGPSSNNLVVDPVPNMRTAAGITGNAGVSVNKLYNTY